MPFSVTSLHIQPLETLQKNVHLCLHRLVKLSFLSKMIAAYKEGKSFFIGKTIFPLEVRVDGTLIHLHSRV